MSGHKREIRICSQMPGRLSKDTIYVIKSENSKDIQIVSGENFGYSDFSRTPSSLREKFGRMVVSSITNYIGHAGRRGYYHLPLEAVLGALLEENDAVVKGRQGLTFLENFPSLSVLSTKVI